MCPKEFLKFSLCANILLAFVGIIFMPVIFVIGPVIGACAVTFGACSSIIAVGQSSSQFHRRNCCEKSWLVIFALINSLGIVLPWCLALAGLASAVLLSLGTIFFLYQGLVYIGRISFYLIAKWSRKVFKKKNLARNLALGTLDLSLWAGWRSEN